MNFNHYPQRSVMGHDFSRVPHADIPRSKFRRSHGVKTTFNSGYLIPIYVDEVLPGDTFKVNLSSIARLNRPIAPIMDNLRMDFFFFAVPNRLIWDNWQKFMGEQKNPGDSTDYLVPVVNSPAAGWDYLSMADYFGIPTKVANLPVNALHFRAYNLIYNEWFRDQNLQDSIPVPTGDGPDNPADYLLRRRGKRHDYFTSCLPWPQKGPGVELPLGEVAPVFTGDNRTFESGLPGMKMWKSTDGTLPANHQHLAVSSSGYVQGSAGPSSVTDFYQPSNLWTDLSSATAATINSLREAFQLQRMLERDARGGTRYTEIIRSHFRVTSPDARLQRPEYLGGGSRDILFDPVPSTTAAGALPFPTPKHLGAQGFCVQSGVGFTKSFVEHCVIIGLVNVRADLTYQRGLNRMWSRQTKYDYYWPALAHLGEQEVLNKEIFAQGTEADDAVFGYQERWAEYRYYPSLITGLMRSSHPQSLDVWHLSQDFEAMPELNASFIEDNPPVGRVVSAPSEPELFFDGFFDATVVRPMPMYSVPGLIDHF